MKLYTILPLLGALGLAACGGGGGDGGDPVGDGEESVTPAPAPAPSPTPTPSGTFKVLAANDLGMHCMDREYSVYSILPPFNVVNAQVVQQGSPTPKLMGDTQVEVRYSPVTDARGSTNSGSVGKTDFWQHAKQLFGVDLANGQGLTGLYMPADHPRTPGPQPMAYDTRHGWFSAAGIPITPWDDTGRANAYPLLRISAHDKATGNLLASTDVVVPVAQETDCQTCHASGQRAANDPAVQWASDADLEIQSKKNVLLLHDRKHNTTLIDSTPVLCASCHYSAALDLAGQGPRGPQFGKPTMSAALHGSHAFLDDGSRNVEQTCYQCHPGKITQCQRGAMRSGGMQCFECHGGMDAVAGKTALLAGGSLDGQADGQARRPWQDLPRCQSCHTGDALNHFNGPGVLLHPDGVRLQQAYRVGDASASPLLASTSRFAENPNTLFRFSKGHGGLACEGCHGSTHAIWPNADPAANDNVAATQVQGHAGTVIECDTCHKPGSLPLTSNGPHGMHNVNDARWVDEKHGDFYEREPNNCRACHGPTLDGSPLAKVAADRTFSVEHSTVNLRQGEQVACNRCHRKP